MIGSRISQDHVTGPAIDNDFGFGIAGRSAKFCEFSEGLGPVSPVGLT